MVQKESDPLIEDDCATKSVSNKSSSSLISRLGKFGRDYRDQFQKQYVPKFLFLLKKYRLDTENGKRILIGLLAFVFVAIIWFIFDRKTPHEDPDEILRPLSQAPEGYEFKRDPYSYEKAKKILLYNPRHDQVDWGIGLGNVPFQNQECRVQNCFLTADRNLLGDSSESKFDAILFFLPEMDKGDFQSMPAFRRKEQRYVMVTDSPPNDRGMLIGEPLNGFFNWTMSYRMDSDLPAPGGRILHINRELVHVDHKHMIGWNHQDGIISLSSEGISANRSKLIAWYVSDCNSMESHREDYASFVANYLPVDIYGPCGNLECPGGHQEDAYRCTKELAKDYKFVLAFEKSLCKDYISDYFYQVMTLPILPIVMGSGDYSKISPAKSYIDINDFASAKELANYLLYLDDNNLAYLSYFKWKDHFRVVQRDPICGLCEMLNSNLPGKTYRDIVTWFVKNGKCQKGIDMPWMIASLADEIEEKADKRVQRALQNSKIEQLNSHLTDGAVQIEDNDEFHRWNDNWRSAVVSMPGEKSAPAAKESVQRIVAALENTVGNSVTNVESKAFRVAQTKQKVEDLKKTHIFKEKSGKRFEHSQVIQIEKEKAKEENIKKVKG